jgi:hypothetical protein
VTAAAAAAGFPSLSAGPGAGGGGGGTVLPPGVDPGKRVHLDSLKHPDLRPRGRLGGQPPDKSRGGHGVKASCSQTCFVSPAEACMSHPPPLSLPLAPVWPSTATDVLSMHTAPCARCSPPPSLAHTHTHTGPCGHGTGPVFWPAQGSEACGYLSSEIVHRVLP